jgi:hypothetical protein
MQQHETILQTVSVTYSLQIQNILKGGVSIREWKIYLPIF